MSVARPKVQSLKIVLHGGSKTNIANHTRQRRSSKAHVMEGLILEKLTVSSSAPDLLCTQSYSLLFEIVLKTKAVTTNLDARLEVQGES